MLEEPINLQLLSKRFAGGNLKLFFGQKGGIPQKVLVFSGLAAFIETEFASIDSYLLQVREGTSVYGLDISMRFNKPEYADYIETFLFVNKEGPISRCGRSLKRCGCMTLTNYPQTNLIIESDIVYER